MKMQNRSWMLRHPQEIFSTIAMQALSVRCFKYIFHMYRELFRYLCMLKSFLKMYNCHSMLFKHYCLWQIKRMKCTGLSSYDFYYFKVSVNQSGGVQFIPCQQRYDTFTSWSGSPIMQYAVHSSNGTYIVSEDKGQGNDITIWVVHLDCTLIWITTI